MTYASIILSYELKKNKINEDPKTTQSLKGKFTSAMKAGGAAVKNAIQNPGNTFQTLGKYLQANEDKITNKFSGIALAQMLASGKVTNEEALNYLFLGYAPAIDKQYVAMGYSGAQQMKEAMKNGTINVGSFVSGFTKVQKSIVDYGNSIKDKMGLKANNVIEIDITLSHNEQYQSESPDRRVENGTSYQEVLHNLPETFSLECGLQDGRRYGVEEFKGYLTQLRDSKQVFKMTIGDEQLDNLVLQSFSPSVAGARSGLDYTLEIKKVHVGSVESTPITIQAPPKELTEGTSGGSGTAGNVSVPNYVGNPASVDTKGVPNRPVSLLVKEYTKTGENRAGTDIIMPEDF